MSERAGEVACVCPYTPPEMWLSAASCGYGGGYEPGSMQEWDPDCPVHPAEDQNLPCLATGETDVDGAVLPVACDLWLGHDRSHYDETVIVFWGREHGGREHATTRPAQEPSDG